MMLRRVAGHAKANCLGKSLRVGSACAQSAAARRAVEAQLRSLTTKFAGDRSWLVGALRQSLQKRMPTAYEVVYEYRDCFVISYSPNEHGYDGVLAVRGSADDVKLYFNLARDCRIRKDCCGGRQAGCAGLR